MDPQRVVATVGYGERIGDIGTRGDDVIRGFLLQNDRRRDDLNHLVVLVVDLNAPRSTPTTNAVFSTRISSWERPAAGLRYTRIPFLIEVEFAVAVVIATDELDLVAVAVTVTVGDDESAVYQCW